MNATYRLNVDELDESFVQRIKREFAHRPLEIAVLDQDETEYLLSEPDNRERLLKAVEDVKNGKNLVELGDA
jgi:antitoxin YefM